MWKCYQYDLISRTSLSKGGGLWGGRGGSPGGSEAGWGQGSAYRGSKETRLQWTLHSPLLIHTRSGWSKKEKNMVEYLSYDSGKKSICVIWCTWYPIGKSGKKKQFNFLEKILELPPEIEWQTDNQWNLCYWPLLGETIFTLCPNPDLFYLFFHTVILVKYFYGNVFSRNLPLQIIGAVWQLH